MEIYPSIDLFNLTLDDVGQNNDAIAIERRGGGHDSYVQVSVQFNSRNNMYWPVARRWLKGGLALYSASLTKEGLMIGIFDTYSDTKSMVEVPKELLAMPMYENIPRRALKFEAGKTVEAVANNLGIVPDQLWLGMETYAKLRVMNIKYLFSSCPSPESWTDESYKQCVFSYNFRIGDMPWPDPGIEINIPSPELHYAEEPAVNDALVVDNFWSKDTVIPAEKFWPRPLFYPSAKRVVLGQGPKPLILTGEYDATTRQFTLSSEAEDLILETVKYTGISANHTAHVWGSIDNVVGYQPVLFNPDLGLMIFPTATEPRTITFNIVPIVPNYQLKYLKDEVLTEIKFSPTSLPDFFKTSLPFKGFFYEFRDPKLRKLYDSWLKQGPMPVDD